MIFGHDDEFKQGFLNPNFPRSCKAAMVVHPTVIVI